MKIKGLTVAILAAFSASANAGPGLYAGISYVFGTDNGVGLTLQATSSDNEDKWVAAAGVSFYPFAGQSKLGIPVGVGYQGSNAAGLIGYDLLLKGVTASLGYVDTDDDTPPPLIVD